MHWIVFFKIITQKRQRLSKGDFILSRWYLIGFNFPWFDTPKHYSVFPYYIMHIGHLSNLHSTRVEHGRHPETVELQPSLRGFPLFKRNANFQTQLQSRQAAVGRWKIIYRFSLLAFNVTVTHLGVLIKSYSSRMHVHALAVVQLAMCTLKTKKEEFKTPLKCAL